ncbi:hypothetical protein CHARACLAT_010349 [Characodon lateralis]|uniref:Uncharacterized protein n=1 Tax=Characodon lateralis TaxID=208331 RepID=A0ABU7CM37_9TELE|nr:hypothetical protein [Characodon lateralis]
MVSSTKEIQLNTEALSKGYFLLGREKKYIKLMVAITLFVCKHRNNEKGVLAMERKTKIIYTCNGSSSSVNSSIKERNTDKQRSPGTALLSIIRKTKMVNMLHQCIHSGMKPRWK